MRVPERFFPYAVAIGSTAIAFLLTLRLEPFLLRTNGSFFYIAIIVTAWYGGWRLGCVTLFLATLAIKYFFIPPLHQLAITQPVDLLRLSIFFLICLIINFLTNNFRDSKRKIEKLNQQLAREKADLLRVAPSAAQMGMWNWNIATGRIQWSTDQEQLFGLTPETFDGK